MRFPTFLLAAWLATASASQAQERPPEEPGSFRPPDLIELTSFERTLLLDIRYASDQNFMGRRMYVEPRAFLQRPAAEALFRAHRRLEAQGFGIVVFDGYRPWSVTKAFWDATPPDKKIFVADPAKGSRHNRGCAVDVSLYNRATGAVVRMPGDYDEMSERSYPSYTGGTEEERSRRDMLRHAMEQEGFFVYSHEWWHFDYKDWREYPILDVPFGALPRTTPPQPPLDLARAKLVDLTHSFDESTLYWPNAPGGFELEMLHFGPSPAGFFYAANSFTAPEHGGTHLDAPIHFAEKGLTTDALPLTQLVAPAVVIDVTAKVVRDPDYRLTVDDLREWEKKHGLVARGSAVLLRTGWDARWPDRKRYLGDDTPGKTTDLHFPAFGKEAAELLVKDRGVTALGLDTPSLDHGPSTDFPVHRIVAAADIAGFENLKNLDSLPPTGAWILALPMKIARGSGAPLRALAAIPQQ